MLFIIFITHLKSIGSTNYITKYADDSSLLVPEKYDVDLSGELRNVIKWAEHNKMQVNMTKTKEIVFHKPNARNVSSPSQFSGIQRAVFWHSKGLMCQVVGCLAASGYGHEEAC